MKNNEDIKTLKHGNIVNCYLDGISVTGTVYIENRGSGNKIVYLCQDEIEGTYNPDKNLFGHKYSVIIGSMDKKYANYNGRVRNLIISDSNQNIQAAAVTEKEEPTSEKDKPTDEKEKPAGDGLIEFTDEPGRFEKKPLEPVTTEVKPAVITIEPHEEWVANRAKQIANAIAVRAKQQMEIPIEWIEEYNSTLFIKQTNSIINQQTH